MTTKEAQEIVTSLRQGKKHYEEDYFGGEALSFGYDNDRKQFYVTRFDTIVGSYNTIDYYNSESIIIEFLVEFETLRERVGVGKSKVTAIPDQKSDPEDFTIGTSE